MLGTPSGKSCFMCFIITYIINGSLGEGLWNQDFLSEDSEDEEAEKEKTLTEKWQEEHEEHEILWPGVEVRVAYEDLMHKLRYGGIGKVIGHKGGQVAVLLEKSFVPSGAAW